MFNTFGARLPEEKNQRDLSFMTSATALRKRALSGSLAVRSLGTLITGNLRNSESMMGKAIGHSRVNSPMMTISLGASAETIMCIGHG
jgi:hypothetical protein